MNVSVMFIMVFLFAALSANSQVTPESNWNWNGNQEGNSIRNQRLTSRLEANHLAIHRKWPTIWKSDYRAPYSRTAKWKRSFRPQKPKRPQYRFGPHGGILGTKGNIDRMGRVIWPFYEKVLKVLRRSSFDLSTITNRPLQCTVPTMGAWSISFVNIRSPWFEATCLTYN